MMTIVGILIAIYALTFLVLWTRAIFWNKHKALNWFTASAKYFMITFVVLLILAAILGGNFGKDLPTWEHLWR
jgi:hypothetical protein